MNEKERKKKNNNNNMQGAFQLLKVQQKRYQLI